MEKRFLVVTIVVFLVAFTFSFRTACAAPEKPIEIKWSLFLPPTHHIIKTVYNPFVKQLEERTKGRVKIVLYPGSALGAPKDQYDLVLRGIADMTTHVPAYTPGRFPLTSVMTLPLSIPSGRVGGRVMWELYEKYLKSEYSDVKVLMFSTHEPGQIHTNKKIVKTLADLKGMKIRPGSPVQNPVLKAWGCSPININIAETYEALQKGMADGTWTGSSALQDFRLNEVIKFHTIINNGVPVSVMVMNLKTWNSLSPDIQQVFNDLGGLKLSMKQGEEFDNRARDAMDEAKKLGHEIYTLPLSERKNWLEKTQEVNEAWIVDMEKKGLPGRKVFQEAVSLLEEYSK